MIKSAWWIVYYKDEKGNPKFLILKRYALSKKIEWIAPKWKIKPGESPIDTAIREVSEETGINPKYLKPEWFVGDLEIHLESEDKWKFDKKITYYLLKYTWDPNQIYIPPKEGYLGIYKWASIDEVLNLVSYQKLREIFFNAYQKILWKN